jgi:hypothetical protein
VRVREGGQALATVELHHGAFACALSRGQHPRLFVVAWGGPQTAQPTGQVVAFPGTRTRRWPAVNPGQAPSRHPSAGPISRICTVTCQLTTSCPGRT